jgi:hypothetical protein
MSIAISQSNICYMYGYAQGYLKHVATCLRTGSMNPEEAAIVLIALEKTMQRLFEECNESGAHERINENFVEFRRELRQPVPGI